MTEIRRNDTSPLTGTPRVRGTAPAPAAGPAAPTATADAPRIGSQVASEQRKAELVSEANRSVVMAAHATQEYVVASTAGDTTAATKAHDQATAQMAKYQGAVNELKSLGQDYTPPKLPTPEHEQLVRQGLLRQFSQRLEAAKGSTLGTLSAELTNDMQAIGHGLVNGSRHLWDRVVHFVHDPVGDAKSALTDAASLLMHPIRNLAHLMQSVDRFGDKSHYEQLMDIADTMPNLLLAPAVVPVLSDAKEGIRKSEKLATDRLLDRIATDGADAPPGRTAIGTAVNRAVLGTHNGTMDPSHAFTSGVIDDLWMNRPDGNDDAIHKVCELIRTEAKQEVSFQTYIFDSKSPAARELLTTLAAKQKEDPAFKIHIVVDRPGIEKELVKYGIHADVAAARPLVSRRGQHTKMFVIDGKIGVIGGDNVDNPKEKDLLMKVRGPVVQSLLADFDDAWKRSTNHFNSDGTPPAHSKDDSPTPAGAVPMTMLGKKGELGFYSKDYEGNDADQGLLAAFAAARSTIKIQSPNLNADAVLKAIRDAASRGVKVQINIPLDYNFVGSSLDAAGNRAFKSFLAGLPDAVRSNIELRNFSTNGQTGESNHTKFVSIDDQWAYVGSQNMDNQSFSFSRELGVGVDDPTEAQRLTSKVFDKDWQTSLPVELGWSDKLLPHAFFDH